MKKGFTLVELIGVIIVLGVLGLIAVVSVSGTLKDSKEKLCESQLDSFVEAAKTFMSANIHRLPVEEAPSTVTLRELKDEGLIEDDVKNPKTEELFSDDIVITVTKSGKSFKYEIDTNLCK